jgi:hypothetical protein
MKRRILDPEEQKTLNRWRLAVVGVYGTIVAALIIVASLNATRDSGTLDAQLKPATTAVQANGPRQIATQH